MKKFLLSITLLTSSIFATNYSFYAGHINYNKSFKKYGNFSGIYMNNYSYGKNFWMEFNPSILSIKYKDNSKYTLKQVSYALNYTTPFVNQNFITTYLSWSGLWESQYGNKSFSKVLNIGFKDYNSLLGYVINPSYYYSQYSNFKVTQPTISLGYYFYPKLVDNDIGYFYIQGTFNHINITKNIAPKKSYNNIDLAITNIYQNLETTIKGSFGKFAYKSESKGFVVYNLGDKYKYKYNIDFSYKLNSYTLGISASYAKMEDKTESLITSFFIKSSF